MVWADGEVSTEENVIYFAKNLQVGLFKGLTYDFGGIQIKIHFRLNTCH